MEPHQMRPTHPGHPVEYMDDVNDLLQKIDQERQALADCISRLTFRVEALFALLDIPIDAPLARAIAERAAHKSTFDSLISDILTLKEKEKERASNEQSGKT